MNKILQLHFDNAKREKKIFNMARNGAEATIYIYDIIDPYWGVSAAGVMADIAAAGDAAVLHVRVNSPGGDVFESRAIIEAIKRFAGKTIAHIDSLAASAATSISLACDEVEMSDGGFFMIHNASGIAWGDKADMRKTADLLEKVEGVIASEYAAETGQDITQVVSWMDDETWFTCAEAIAAGFVDRSATVVEKTSNAWNLAAYSKVPKELANVAPMVESAPVVPPPAEPPASDQPPVANSMTTANRNRLTLALAQ
ncbi:head maturation protease, ClpP-related [Massilia sp. S19_KUP03_FR1]|uniref:head maturation protease, ClpP-related n=1 Tax=Massilia sp. S19_KUP03_FR1 TaxID=3025503 RepID=UPI002FCCFC63